MQLAKVNLNMPVKQTKLKDAEDKSNSRHKRALPENSLNPEKTALLCGGPGIKEVEALFT